ncbi:hypothetical protein ACFFHM_00465 [Halalkalibacter kiskunsagensis]|uniref:Uncharacterized protein n=1 Tax=Halalkalibacter kiskunsagensis TaxID=1548599 RepID=A0ABV6K6Z4_9BACI
MKTISPHDTGSLLDDTDQELMYQWKESEEGSSEAEFFAISDTADTLLRQGLHGSFLCVISPGDMTSNQIISEVRYAI